MSNEVSNHSNTAANGDRMPPATIAAALNGTNLHTLPLVAFGDLVVLKKEGQQKGKKYMICLQREYMLCVWVTPWNYQQQVDFNSF